MIDKRREQIECHRLIILSYEEEMMVDVSGKKIEVIPVWKWLIK